MSAGQAMPSIDFSKDGLRIDGHLVAEVSIERLEERLGKPRLYEMDGPEGDAPLVWAVWDDLGLRTAARGDTPSGDIDVTIVDGTSGDPEPWFPTSTYTGEITIDGVRPIEAAPVEQLRTGRPLIDITAGGWEVELFLNDADLPELEAMDFKERFAKSQTGEITDMIRAAERPFSSIIASRALPQPTRKAPASKPSGKWKLPVVDEPVLTVKSFPFRLAVIEELMFNQGVLEPRFDVHAFSRDQGAKNFDPDDYAEEMIPSVGAWFRKYPIPARLAATVKELVLDGGNDVYLQLIPQWDGEDDQFVIASLSDADLAPFTNLRRVQDIAGFLGPRARKALEKRGVEIE